MPAHCRINQSSPGPFAAVPQFNRPAWRETADPIIDGRSRFQSVRSPLRQPQRIIKSCAVTARSSSRSIFTHPWLVR